MKTMNTLGLRNVFSLQDQVMSWTLAQFTCKATNGTGLHRLANVRNTSEVKMLSRVCNDIPDNDLNEAKCFVGLQKLDDTWYRTDGEENVLPLQPGKSKLERMDEKDEKDECAIVYQDNLHTHNCIDKLAHICEKYFFVLVKEEKSWEEALLHCRAMGVDKGLPPGSYDLLSLHTHEDLSFAQEELVHAGTREVWVGLRWLAARWLWMDGEEHSVWKCPADWTHCGSLSRQRLDARSCMEKRNFFCQRVNAVNNV
uniref:C-type lectin domain-containing protein n=1 Tax=Gadus morhua TaxID=8049 RepID=A0A8C5A2K7_GADMO